MADVLFALSVLVSVFVFVRSELPRKDVSWESGVRLDGSRTSYVQFSPWSLCRNASLSFDFETRRSTALLVYADDGRRFVKVRLVRGSLQLRYRLSKSADRDFLATAGDGLGDGRWHAVQLRSSDGSRLVLTVDGAVVDAEKSGGQRATAIQLTTGT